VVLADRLERVLIVNPDWYKLLPLMCQQSGAGGDGVEADMRRVAVVALPRF
jgi:hypothetical protein